MPCASSASRLRTTCCPARHQIQMVGPDGTLNPHTEQGTQPGHEYSLPRRGRTAGRLRAARRRPPRQRPDLRAGPAGPARRLPVLPRPGGLPGRRRAVPARGRLAVPDLPRLRGRDRPRRRPGRDADPAARRLALRLRPRRAQGRHPVHPAGHPAAARRRAWPTRPSCRGEDTVVLALFGDGATSEGDFHEALNFAAVFQAPVVFFVQNNQYAISVPLAQQTVAPSLAHKGVGYGMPGEQVDGNDLVALLAVLGRAVERARGGARPAPGRGAHLPDGGAHQRRRRHPLPGRRRGRRLGRPRTRSPGWRPTCGAGGLLDDAAVPRRTGRGRGRGRRSCATG